MYRYTQTRLAKVKPVVLQGFACFDPFPGRLAGNVQALRQAEATRKATADAISKILAQNISVEPETRDAYKRKSEDGEDIFGKIFKKSKGAEIPLSKVRLFRTTLDQLQDLALKGNVEGVLLGSRHPTLSWRPTTCIVFQNGFDKDSADAFMVEAGLTKLGIISNGGSKDPTEATFAKLQEVASTSECKFPLLLHFTGEEYQATFRAFEADFEKKTAHEVSIDFIARRVNGEDVKVLGSRVVESKASTSRTAVFCLQTREHRPKKHPICTIHTCCYLSWNLRPLISWNIKTSWGIPKIEKSQYNFSTYVCGVYFFTICQILSNTKTRWGIPKIEKCQFKFDLCVWGVNFHHLLFDPKSCQIPKLGGGYQR